MAEEIETRPLPWHVINGEDFLDALRRVAQGEDPELVYIELYANADRGEDAS